MQKKNIVIFGATSRIAIDVAKQFAADGHELFLVGRNERYLRDIVADLSVRHERQYDYLTADLNHTEKHADIVNDIKTIIGNIDIAVIAHGLLPDQKKCETDFEYLFLSLQTNFISSVSLLTHLAGHFEDARRGTLAVFSSVAGDRGRQSNYAYGSAKAGLNVFLQGLRHRLADKGVRVLTIKPGIVDTPMTRHLKKGILCAEPDLVARKIVRGVYRGKSEIYAPGFWRYIMFIIRQMPERVFHKLNI